MISICFVANFSKTYLYRHIADELRRRDPTIQIKWIFVSSELQKLTGGDDSILLDFDSIRPDAKAIGDFKINEIVGGDRVLRTKKALGQAFLRSIQEPLLDFLSRHKIKYIFGERTWAHEILLGRMVSTLKHLGCCYLSFGTVRIPAERFAFFEDEQESRIVEFWNDTVGQVFVQGKPKYLKLNDQILAESQTMISRLRRLGRFLTGQNVGRRDPTTNTSFFWRLRLGVREEANRVLYQFVKRQQFAAGSGQKFVFLGFHKQPENSIDVFGRYYEDQYTNVYNVWRLLPPQWKLFVKEHTNAIGDRSLQFYSRIKKLPGVCLIHEKTSALDLIHEAEITISVTGTICLEAALEGRKAILLRPTFFGGLRGIRVLSWVDLSGLPSISALPESEGTSIEEYREFILANSFIGNVLDPTTDPSVLEKDNVSQITQAFLALLHRTVASERKPSTRD